MAPCLMIGEIVGDNDRTALHREASGWSPCSCSPHRAKIEAATGCLCLGPCSIEACISFAVVMFDLELFSDQEHHSQVASSQATHAHVSPRILRAPCPGSGRKLDSLQQAPRSRTQFFTVQPLHQRGLSSCPGKCVCTCISRSVAAPTPTGTMEMDTVPTTGPDVTLDQGTARPTSGPPAKANEKAMAPSQAQARARARVKPKGSRRAGPSSLETQTSASKTGDPLPAGMIEAVKTARSGQAQRGVVRPRMAGLSCWKQRRGDRDRDRNPSGPSTHRNNQGEDRREALPKDGLTLRQIRSSRLTNRQPPPPQQSAGPKPRGSSHEDPHSPPPRRRRSGQGGIAWERS